MHFVSVTKVMGWGIVRGTSGVFVPLSVDIVCPFCHRNPVNFPFPNGWEARSDSAFAVSRCPACAEISRFWVLDSQSQNQEEAESKARIFMDPTPPFVAPYDEKVRQVSPTFDEIYSQAAKAEALGLTHLNGVGYRKALEYLIKDWLTQLNPEKKEAIQKTALNACINNFVSDPNIKMCAERAIWLGNDETHYVRKWADKDVQDLKVLLSLTFHWISSSLLSQEYLKNMPVPPKPQL